MQCPNDQTTLAMTERSGIEIDYCPTCRGVWLDRGELDKLIGNSESSVQPSVQQPMPQQEQRQYQEPKSYQEDNRSNHNDNSHYQKKHKKESFLGDLFDF